MHIYLLVAGNGEVPDLLEPFADYGGQGTNENAKFDWFQVGGMFKCGLALKQPKTTNRLVGLFIIAMVTPWLFLAVYFGTPMLNSQTRHMRAVDAHIEKIAPQWERFRAEHPGFDDVKLFAYTDGDGMFGARGYVVSAAQVSEL